VLLIPDRPGMLVLRTLSQLANGAADAVTDDVASVEAVDEAMTYGANHPEGPLHWAERAGYARVATALGHIADATGDDMYQPARFLLRK
jgi:3-hydroxybutyryl-CoA dehydrogenase